MAEDEVAKTALVYDASGAQKGAAEFKAASEQVIAAEAAAGGAATAAANTVAAAETKKATARRSGAKAAQEVASAEAAAAGLAADAVETATKRIQTGSASQVAFLDRLSRQFDPLGAAASKASRNLETLMDIAARGGENAARAAGMFTAATDKLLEAQADLTGGQKQAQAELARLTALFDPATASAQRMTAELADLNKAFQLGVNVAGSYSNAYNDIISKYDESAQAAKRASVAQQDLINTARQAQNAQNSQGAFNQVLGVGAPSAGSAAASAAVFQEAFDAQARLGAEIQNLTHEFNPLLIATAEYQASLARITRAVDLEVISEGEAAAARTKAAAVLKQATDGTARHAATAGQADFATRQLTVQTIQFFSSLQAGQPFLTSFIQQAHQVVDVSVATGTGFGTIATQIGKALSAAGAWAVANPIAVGAGIVVTALAAAGVAAEITANKLITLQNELRATRTDYANLANEVTGAAKAVAATTGIGTADARKAGQAIASSPNFIGSQAQLQDLIKTAGDLAVVMGTTVPEAAQQLAKALQDPAAVAADLANKHFPGMSAALAYDIKLMADGGDKAAAFARVLATVQTTTKGANDNLTPLGAALRDLSNAFTKTGQDGRSLADSIGSAITEAAAKAVNMIAGVVTAIENLRQTSAIQNFPSAEQGAHNAIDAMRRAQTGAQGVVPSLGVKVNPATGATGLMGVMPSTAAGFNLDQNDLFQNVQAGVRDFQTKLATAGGNIDLALKNYGGFVTKDPSAYIASVHAQKVGTLSTDNAGLIQGVAMALGVKDPRVITVLQQLALQESSGQHFEAKKFGPPEVFGPPDLMGPQATNDQITAAKQFQATLFTSFQQWQNSGVLSTRIDANRAQQSQAQMGITAFGAAGDEQNAQRQKELLDDLRGKETLLITEQEKLAQSSVDASVAFGKQAGFTRAMAEIDTEFAVISRVTGKAVDEKAVAVKKAAVASQLLSGFTDQIAQSGREADAQRAAAAAFDGTAKSMDHAQNFAKAYNEALKTIDPTSADFNARVEEMTKQLDATSAASRAAGDQQKTLALTATNTADAFTKSAGFVRAMAQVDAEFKAAQDASGVAIDQKALAAKKQAVAIQLLAGVTDQLAATSRDTTAQQAAAAAFDGTARSMDHAQNVAKAYEEALKVLPPGTKEFNDLVEQQTRVLDANSAATRAAGDQQKAMALASNDAARALTVEGSFEQAMLEIEVKYAAAVRTSGAALNLKAQAQEKADKTFALATSFNVQVRDTNLATAAQLRINAAYDGSAESLERATNHERAYALALADYGKNSPILVEKTDELTAAFNRGSDATRVLREHQEALQAISGAFTQAFDSIGQAITNSLLQGAGAAVNWRNVMTAVAQQVLQAFLKLAVLQPILNAAFGQNGATLSTVIGALSNGGSTRSTATAAPGQTVGINDLLNVGSAADKISGGSLSGEVSDFLGLKDIGSGLKDFLATPLIGQTAGQAASTIEAADVAAATGQLGTESGALGISSAGPELTLGGALGAVGAIGAGFGLGSLAGGLIQSSLGKVGPAPEIGAGAGAAAGAIVGTVVFPVIGTAIGALAGGILGGAAGGFIGPKAESAFSTTPLTIGSGGELSPSGTLFQGVDVTDQVNALISDVNTLNQAMKVTGTQLTTLGPLTQVGTNTPGEFQDPSKFNDIASAFGGFRFSAPGDSTLNSFLSGRQFGNFQDFQTATTAVSQFDQIIAQTGAAGRIKDFVDTLATVPNADIPGKLQGIVTFITQTVPVLTAINDVGTTIVNGSLADSLAKINTVYTDAITTAHQLGYAEEQLTVARDKQFQAAYDAAAKATLQLDQNLTARLVNAQALTGSNGVTPLGAQLYSFDIAAQQQRDALGVQLVATYGDAFKATDAYAGQIALLESVLGEERLAIIKQANGQIVNTTTAAAQAQSDAAKNAANVISSLVDYTRSLSLGTNSPLSLKDQYTFAANQFNAVAGAAAAGDFNSISKVQTYAEAFRSASRSVFGSGAGYVTDVGHITDLLGQISLMSPDTLTSAAFTVQMQSLSDTIANGQATLADLLKQLVQLTKQASMRPAAMQTAA